MGIFSWFKDGGALGGLAKSVGAIFRAMEQRQAKKNDLETYIRVVGFRYMNSPLPRAKQTSGAVLHFMRQKISEGEEFGLVALCFSIAAREMDVVGIESNVLRTIADNLKKMEFTEEQMRGRAYSVDEFDAAIESM